MSLSDPRLAWSVVLAPRRDDVGPPPWPVFVTDVVGSVHLPAVDPLAHVLRGPFPVGTLSRGRTLGGLRFALSGAGRSAVLTLVDQEPGEAEAGLRLDSMRARIASTLLGLDVPEAGTPTELEATPERRSSTATATRSARPRALKSASAWWWSSRPYSTLACKFMRAWTARVSRK